LGEWTSTEEQYGYNGPFVIPRQATNVWYNTSTVATEVSVWKYLYPTGYTMFNPPKTAWPSQAVCYTQIMALETDRASQYLLQYRHDPYMFHQANTHSLVFQGKTTSLLAMWTDMVIAGISQYTMLPITTLKMDDLGLNYLNRRAMLACAHSIVVRVDNGQVSGVNVSYSSGGCNCTLPISGVSLKADSSVKIENYGPDVTSWVTLGTPVDLRSVYPETLPEPVALSKATLRPPGCMEIDSYIFLPIASSPLQRQTGLLNNTHCAAPPKQTSPSPTPVPKGSTPASQAKSDTLTDNSMIWIGILAAVAVVAVVLTIVFWRRRQQRQHRPLLDQLP